MQSASLRWYFKDQHNNPGAAVTRAAAGSRVLTLAHVTQANSMLRMLRRSARSAAQAARQPPNAARLRRARQWRSAAILASAAAMSADSQALKGNDGLRSQCSACSRGDLHQVNLPLSS